MQTLVVRQISLLLLLVGLSWGKGPKKAAELKIKTEYKPDSCSELADNEDEVGVHYTGYLESGAIFDSSVQAQREPLVFKIGEGRVIPGWEMGIKGMCVGEKRKLIVPPHLAYGKRGYPPAIPEEATLTFETELISLKKKPWNFDVLGLAQMLAIPIMVIYVLYYLYDRYKKESTETKELKKENKELKKNKKKK